MIRRLAIGLVIAALVGFAPAARADLPNTVTAVYFDDYARITLTAAPGTQFIVRAEQADGSYANVWGGTVGLLPASRVLVNQGPANNEAPQFIVTFFGPSGSETVFIDDLHETWYW